MKKVLMLMFMLPASYFLKAQAVFAPPIDSITNKYTYTEVVKVDSVTAKDLFSRAKLFIAGKFNSAKDVIELSDEANQTLVCDGNLATYYTVFGELGAKGYISFRLTIQTKDGRYKYTLTDLVYTEATSMGVSSYKFEFDMNSGKKRDEKYAKRFNDIKEDGFSNCKLLIISGLKTAMASNSDKSW